MQVCNNADEKTCVGDINYTSNFHLDSFGREDTEPYCSPETTGVLPSQFVEVETWSQEDLQSIASTSTSGTAVLPGKRK